MRVLFWLAVTPVVLAAVAIALFEMRIIVFQPLGALPDGATALVSGLPDARLIDSPDGMCFRELGEATSTCRAFMSAGIASSGTMLLRFAFSERLYDLTVPTELRGPET